MKSEKKGESRLGPVVVSAGVPRDVDSDDDDAD